MTQAKEKKITFIVNPNAGFGHLEDVWDRLKEGIQNKVGEFDYRLTSRPKHATQLVRQALKEGFTTIIAVGGDGTLNECLNGFLEDGKAINPKATLGIFPYGRGSDLARSLKMPKKLDPLINILTQHKTKPLDVGMATFLDFKNKKQHHYFINSANVGIVPVVVNKSRKSPKILGSRISYLYGAFNGMIEFQPQPVTYTSKEGEKKCSLLHLMIANGPYFGSGMKAAPNAKLDDGLFDIVGVKEMSFATFLKQFPLFYAGKHLDSPQLDFFRTKKISVAPLTDSVEQPLEVEMDGETLGHIPAEFEILPGAINFLVP